MAGVREIPLTRGAVAVVDSSDYERLVAMGKWTLHNQGYAYRWDRSVQPNRCLLMHRVILDTPAGMDTDHVNRSKLDNRRSNLRVASRSLNSTNRVSSNVEGSKYWRGFVVRMSVDHARIYVGRFSDRFEAEQAASMIKEQILEVSYERD